jgi:hypothetical protein
MTHGYRLGLALVCSLAACSPDEGGEDPGPDLTITSSATSVRADGERFVTITVQGGAPGSVVVTTNLGGFEVKDGPPQIVPTVATPFSLKLYPCDFREFLDCIGTAEVVAQDSAVTIRRVRVDFLPVEICRGGGDEDGDALVDCMDPDCLGELCAAPPSQRVCGDAGAGPVCLP